MNLEKREAELEKKLTEALKRIEELERENNFLKEKVKPSFVKEDVRSYHHKTGQKEGHGGVSRETPKKIDEVKKWDVKECPDCGTKLSRIQRKRKRYITDIEVKTINTENIICGRYCKNCDKIVEPKVTDALPNARFGLKLMLLVLVLKLDSRVPSNKIVSILDSIFQIKISDGEIYGILKQLKTAFGDYYKDLEDHYREAKYIHKRLKNIYAKAKNEEKKDKLLSWIDLISSRSYKSSEIYKFVKSICRTHRDDLFRFVDNPKIDSTNNRAERGLRHAVVIRKISNGSRSKDGAETTANLLSVLQTAKLQSDNPMNFMMDLTN